MNRKEEQHPFLGKLSFILIMLMGVMIIGGWGIFDKKLTESTGKDVNVLKSELEAMNREFIIVEESEFNENVSRGLVSRTDPASGTRVKKGSIVTIYVSKGKPITISDYTNTNIETVKGILASQGLNFNCSSEYSEDVAKDSVISTDPTVGTIVEEGTMVDILVSLGSEYRTVPPFMDITADVFKKNCEEIGIKCNANEDFSDEIEKGYIISCSYSEGDKVSVKSDVIDITVSKGSGIPVPAIQGLSAEKAQATLEKLGLNASIKEEYNSAKKGTVFSASKREGDLVEEGDTIVISVSKGTQEQEFKDSCETPSYDDLIRYPSKYESIKIKIKVKVTKIENETLLGFKYGETIWGTYQGSKIIITDDRDVKEPAFRNGDVVTVYGYGNGTSTINVKQKEYQGGVLIGFTYNKTVDSYDVPNIKVKYAF